jgi:beta-glucosidase-like glycosyl hydrolase
MMHFVFLFAASLLAPGLAGPTPPIATPPNDACIGSNASFSFCDTGLSLEARLDDLVKRIEVDEIASQLTARICSALPRLGIPSYYWGTNALHRIREVSCIDGNICPTVFATPPNYGATFNMSLATEMGAAFGKELRAYYNSHNWNSLDTWSPTININRDPRW